MRVPFVDLRATYAEIGPDLDVAYRRVMLSGTYILGPEVEAFEAEFAAYCGAKHCIGVASGSDALHLILRAMNIGPGDEVIVPANTYVATWLSVTNAGATPVAVEPEEKTYNLDTRKAEGAITERTKAFVPVHLYGQPAEMDPLNRLAIRYKLWVIEDASHAHGARYQGRRAGGLGHAAAFSFYPTKNLGALGDGGAVVTNDATLAEKVRLLRNYGSAVKYQNEVKGFNSRLDELQAALLRVKLAWLDRWNERRRELAREYRDALRRVPDLILPCVPDWAEPVWHQFVVRHPRRDALQRHLADSGIGTLIHYPIPPHLSKAYAPLGYQRGDFPITERIADEVLSLPIGPHLSVEHISFIAGVMANLA